jgi:hypothetical protein
MNIRPFFIAAAGFVLIAGAVHAVAHHSFSAQFDRSKPVNLVGPVTKFEWINPHARFFMDAKDASGKVVNWEIELSATAILLRRGWTRNSLKVGDVVTVTGSAAKNGSSVANATTVVLGNGKRVFAGSSGGDGDGTPAPNP